MFACKELTQCLIVGIGTKLRKQMPVAPALDGMPRHRDTTRAP